MYFSCKNKKILCFCVSLCLLLPTILLLPTASANNPPPANFSTKWSINLDTYYPIGWGSKPNDYCYSSNVPPVAADIDNDGWKEIFLCIGYDHDIRRPPQLNDEGTVYALDPQTGMPFWWYHCDDFGSHTVLSLHDLDGDGDLEVLATGYHNITALHAENGAVLWNHHYPTNRLDKPALVINENDHIWVYTCQNRYNTYEETIQKRWGSNGSIAQEADFPGPIHPCHGGFSCADINNDGELEIISVDRNYGANHQGLSCWSLDLTRLWSHPGIACSTSCGVLLDVNSDDYLDVIVETASDGLYVINGNDGTIQKCGTGLGFSSGEIYTPAVYDIDQDGRYEVIAANSGYAKVFDLGTWSMEATLARWDGQKFWRSPIIANVYGDAKMEMVFGTYAGIQLMGGTHGQYQTIALQNNIHTASDRMLIQDIDNDGKNEIVALAHGLGYGYGSYNYVTCFDTPGAASPGVSSKDFLYNYRRVAVAENIPSYDPDSVSEPLFYTLAIDTIGSGAVTLNPNKTQYSYGETVTVSATPDNGWVFDQWTGDLSGNTSSLTITIDGDKQATALFTQIDYTFDIITIGSGRVTMNPEQSKYHFGDVVTLTAIPDSGWIFTGWNGAYTGMTNPYSITIESNNKINATFQQVEYSLILTTIGEGIITKSPNQTTYPPGQVINLTAIPLAESIFIGWSGDINGSTNPATVTMDADKTITAVFTSQQYTLSITTIGAGTVFTNPEKEYYPYGDVVSLATIPETGWSFTAWSGDLIGDANPELLTITGNTQVTATFTQNEYLLTIDSIGEGTVVSSPDPPYYYGDEVQLTATAATGHFFSGWSGDCTESTNPITITMETNTEITATFTPREYSLSLTTIGNGAIRRNPQQTTYQYGDVVGLFATADTGWSFTGWNGDINGTTNPSAIIIYENHTITATFTQIEYDLNINTIGNGTVTKNPDQSTYHYNDLVHLIAIPDRHWRFNGWSDGITEATNQTSIIISGNMTLTANFSYVNNACTIPDGPSGPTVRTVDQLCAYWTTATDPDGDQLYYLWDWGDGTTSGWLGPYPSGKQVYGHHRWDNDGQYQIAVKAKDSEGFESHWSEPIEVYMTQPTYVIGIINNLSTDGKISLFNADFVVTLRAHPLKLEVFSSDELFMFSKAYNGLVQPKGIIGFFNIATL